MAKIRPLENRPFRFKNARTKFHCPLCASERYLTMNHRLTSKHYLQIAVLTVITTYALFDVMQWRGLFFYFIYLAVYEVARRLVYRSEIPCPYCGFDASSYKRDVKVARRLVKEFWQNKNPVASETATPEQASL